MSDYIILKTDGGKTAGISGRGETVRLEQTPLLFLNSLCLQNGSTAEGRKEAFRQLLHVRQKAAVLVSERTEELWFPIVSDTCSDCVWLRYDRILDIRQRGPYTTVVRFLSGYTADIPCNVRTIRSQMKRCGDFLCIIRQYVVDFSDAGNLRELLKDTESWKNF